MNSSLSSAALGARLLLGASTLLVVDLFFSWQNACANAGPFGKICGSLSGWHGIGILVGILAIALIVWEGVQLAGVAPKLGVAPALVSAGLAAATALFALIEFLSHSQARSWPAWIGLVLAVAIGVGAFRRFAEAGGKSALGPAIGGGGAAGPTPPAASSTPPAPPPPPSSSTPRDPPAPPAAE